MALSGPLPRAIALRISSVAVRQMPSSIGSVEFSMKKSAECSTKPRPVSTGPAFEHLDVFRPHRQLDALARRDHFELHQQIGKFDIARRLVDDDAHGAFAGMRADIDHAAGKTLVAHRRHGDQHLAVEITARGRLVGAFAAELHCRKCYPIDPPLQTTRATESSRHLLSYSMQELWQNLRSPHCSDSDCSQ